MRPLPRPPCWIRLGLALLTALAAPAIAAAEVRTVAVLPLDTAAVPVSPPALRQAVEAAAARLPPDRFRRLSAAHVARYPVKTPCAMLCALDAGRALRADYVVTTRIAAGSAGVAGLLSLYHTRSNRTVATTQAAAGDLATLPVALGAAADRLFDALRPGGQSAPVTARPATRPAARPAPRAAARPAGQPRPAAPARALAAAPVRRPPPSAATQAEIARQRAVAQRADEESDWFEFHLAARTDAVVGNGDMFARYDNVFGAGAEIGVEAFGIDLWGEALIQGSGQYLFSANLGVDLDFGREVRVTLGLYTGPIFLLFPKQPVETLSLTPQDRTALQRAGISASTINALETAYNSAAEEEADLNRLAVGWNLGRVRLAVEWFVAPVMALGAHATGGYHYLLSGEDVAADIKYSAIQDVRRDQGLTAEQATVLQAAVGAEQVDVAELGGVNFAGGIYLKFVL